MKNAQQFLQISMKSALGEKRLKAQDDLNT